MKKPSKPAKKAPAKAMAKKPAAAKKSAVKKIVAKAKAKKPAPKVVPKKATAKKTMSKVASKKTAPMAKGSMKKPMAAKKPDVKSKLKGKVDLKQKIQDKIAASKKMMALKLVKKAAFNKASVKKVDVKKIEKAPKVDKAALKLKAKAAIQATKAAKVEAAKNAKKAEKEAKIAAKLAAKAPKKLTKKEEKELLRARANNEEEMGEDGQPIKRKVADDDDDDFDVDTSVKKVKMTFDEIEEEEIIPVRKKKSQMDDDIKENLAEEILSLSEDFSMEDVFASIRSMELFKVETDECVVRGCDNPSTTSGYCRYHYIKLWKDVKKKQLILSEGRLAKIIEELVRKYPMKYIETIIHDLADDKSFNLVLKDLDIETDDNETDAFDEDELLDDDQDIAFETKVVKPSFDD